MWPEEIGVPETQAMARAKPWLELPLQHCKAWAPRWLVGDHGSLPCIRLYSEHDCLENGIQLSKQKWRPGLVASCVLVPDQSSVEAWPFSPVSCV